MSDTFTPVYWNVAFIGRPVEHWWDVLSPWWARHVVAFGYVPAVDAWVIVNPGVERTAVAAVPDRAFRGGVEAAALADMTTMVRIEAGACRASEGRVLQTCATIVARVIGRKSAWRPVGLLKHLKAEGAEVIHEHQGQGPKGRSRDAGAAEAGRAAG